MLRRNQRFLTQMYVLADLVVMLGLFLAAYWIKFYSGLLVHYSTVPFKTYLLWSTVYAFAAVLIGFYTSFYTPKRRQKFSRDVLKIIQVQTFSLLLLLSLLFITKEVHISRQFIALFFAMNLFGLIIYRFSVKRMLTMARKRGLNKRYVLVLGAGSVGRSFHDKLQLYPDLGYDVYGFLDDFQSEHDAAILHQYKGRQLAPIVGDLDELEGMLAANPTIDEVIIALPLDAHSKYGDLIKTCEKAGVKTLIIPDYFDLLPAKPFFDNFAGVPLINIRDVPLDEMGNRIAKRTFDIAFSLAALIVLSPVMLLIAAGIKLTSPGPILFRQERVGLNRRSFHMLKFRSMRVSTETDASQTWTVQNDPRRTRFGTFLRSTSLDELPQFINVLRGEMSVVGPRPERPFFVDQFREEIPRYMVKHHIRPGITGWAQTNGLRGDTSIDERIRHDIFYIENWSFFFDIRIIFKTVLKGLINKNAY
ncbi:undecaprenyl-phosphate glucose phosphotransferase [Paenibacillus pasadenensis]|uniref:undecaprenyl-phosphate glucose phosphotransferase n=1 Tax=Paenibacillus pasadenensis TaxID=217090 RepID=UPI00203A8F08|nr:undecaprenyl-phosphate glucose phosphotransferase [Paenibacillus pasadenensis]MCM3747638.1 undecaprenyl-phosphate glucose phosphotransferase [Paenibacillus pasadenensis]